MQVEPAQVEVHRRAAQRARHHPPPAVADVLEQGRQQGTADDVDDGVESPARGVAHGPGDGVRVRPADHDGRGARLADRVLLPGRGQRDDARAPGRRELDRREADPARGPGDEHRLARPIRPRASIPAAVP